MGERSWMMDAECIGTELHTSSESSDRYVAKMICSGCIVKDECLEYALQHKIFDETIWGGMSGRQRRRMMRKSAV